MGDCYCESILPRSKAPNRKVKVLNLYAGVGGNRKLWPSNAIVTAVEIRPDIAAVYKHYFPDDTLVIGDAHQYLLDHYTEYDFIWTSPPCPTHSRSRFWRHSTLTEQSYPDMSLYQEIIFLKHYYNGKWVCENVDPFYEPLIAPSRQVGRHLFWSNFRIGNFEPQHNLITEGKRDDWKEMYGFDLSLFDIESRKDQIYRNCVDPETGLYIFNCAMNVIQSTGNQASLF